MQHDFYRPAGWHFLKGGLDANGKVVAWQQHFVSFGRDGKFAPSADLSADTYPARRIANLSYGASLLPLGVPTGPLRAPGDNALAFVFQSFIDELAHKAGKDPLQFQIDLLGKDELLPGRGLGFNTARARGVLEKVREVSGWGNRQLPERTGLGVAHYYSHLGYFAEVVEAAVAANGKIKINKVWAVGDIGSHVINPTAAFNMAQGAILDGFAEALQQKIRIEGGRVVEANFDTFPLLRMSQVAPIEVHFLTSDNSPTGLGEPPLPPAIPAPFWVLCSGLILFLLYPFFGVFTGVRDWPIALLGHVVSMLGWILVGAVLGAALLRAIVYFRDSFRATNCQQDCYWRDRVNYDREEPARGRNSASCRRIISRTSRWGSAADARRCRVPDSRRTRARPGPRKPTSAGSSGMGLII